jgi:hypothetical protein
VSPRLRRWSFRLLTAVALPLLLLLAIEGALRLRGFGFSTALTRPCSVGGRASLCDNKNFSSLFFPPGLRRVAAPWSIPAAKEPGTFRVFVLGESAAGGDPEPSFGLSRYLEVMLRERFPGTRFEIVNTAITAINSHALVPMARDLARREGDLFVVYAGNNEVVGPFGPGTVLTAQASSLPVIRAGLAVRSTRTGQLLADVLRRDPPGERPRWRGMEMFLERRVAEDDPALRTVYRNFEANLRDVLAAARGAGARVVVSTVGANLRDCAPFASLHRRDLAPGDLAAWEDLRRRAEVLERDGQAERALELRLAAAAIDDQHAELQFRIAHLLLAKGDVQGARARFERARDLDALRFRPDRHIDRAIRSVAAAAGPGVELVDGAAALAEASPHRLPGREVFWEHVHPTPAGNYLLARALLPAVERALPASLRAAASRAVPSREECDRRLALTSHDQRRIATEVLVRLERPPFTQLAHAELVRAAVRVTTAEAEDGLRIVAQYQWALEQNPRDRLLNLNYGRFLEESRHPAAAVYLERARARDDSPAPRDVYDH